MIWKIYSYYRYLLESDKCLNLKHLINNIILRFEILEVLGVSTLTKYDV